jgi:hypothetical protein
MDYAIVDEEMISIYKHSAKKLTANNSSSSNNNIDEHPCIKATFLQHST